MRSGFWSNEPRFLFSMKLMSRKAAQVALGLVLLGCVVAVLLVPAHPNRQRLLLAPMMNVLEPCLQPTRSPVVNAPLVISQWCGENATSLAPVVETTLSALGPRLPANPHLELGYTLAVPLLRMLKRQDGDWVVDRPLLNKMVRTLSEVDRPVIVYLFSTHFGVNAPIEHELASDPNNLLLTQSGALPVDSYLGDEVFPWNFTTTDNGITKRRLQVVDAILEEICLLPESDLAKLRGITMLGELHHMFPKLESGMGFQAPYLITDYSDVSRQDFRAFLKTRFKNIDDLNRVLQSDYRSFAELDPPSKDIRSQALTRFAEHIDAFAHGSFPVAGWAHVPELPKGAQPWVRIYRNGKYLGRVPVRGGRQDVAKAHPEYGTADVGWQYHVDFKSLEVGQHQLDMMLEVEGQELLHLASREVSVMGRDQSTPPVLPVEPLPAHRKVDSKISWFVDSPQNKAAYFYNPLVPLWHEFRGEQVMRYLAFFDQHIRRSCLHDKAIYTHQILPFINPDWDTHRFAAERSLQPFGQTKTGISLYGEATYGGGFGQWFESSKLKSYGVTEFHPLKAMPPEALAATLESHRLRGAEFLSFFLEPRGLTPGSGVGLNQFSFDPQVRNFGSDKLYQAMKMVINQQPPP